MIIYNAVVVVVVVGVRVVVVDVVVGHGPVHTTEFILSSCLDISHKRLDC
jgi:hypothetical protein